jgi:hypothetical protein
VAQHFGWRTKIAGVAAYNQQYLKTTLKTRKKKKKKKTNRRRRGIRKGERGKRVPLSACRNNFKRKS